MLKLCPCCQFHKPTRAPHVVCSQCRRDARLRAELKTLSPRQKTYLNKLVAHGVRRSEAIRLAWREQVA